MPRPPTHSEMITVEPSDLVQDVLSILEGANIPTEVNDLVVERIEAADAAATATKHTRIDSLSIAHEKATNQVYDLYCFGQQWMDRARKSEHLNSSLLLVLKNVWEDLDAANNESGAIRDVSEDTILQIKAVLAEAGEREADFLGM